MSQPEMAGTPATEDKAARQVWDSWLDGDTVSYIARNTDLSPTRVKAILAADPPEEIATDLRHVHGCRALWIGMSQLPSTGPFAGQTFLPVFQPRRCTGDAFAKGVRAAARKFRELTGGAVNLGVIEGMEMDVMMKFANEKGYMAFRFDDAGNLVDGIPGATPVADDVPAPGMP